MAAVMHGIQVANKRTYYVCAAVPCTEPYCKSAAGWPCSTRNGKWSSTAHASRWAAYLEAQKANANERR